MKGLFRYRELLIRLAWKEIRVRYKEPILGLAWAFLVPVLMTLIFMFVFTKIVKIPFRGYPFFIFLALGLFPWNFFNISIITSTMSILESGTLIKKVYFPREIIPVSIVFANGANFLCTLIAVIILIIFCGVKFSIWLLLLPAAFILQLLFTCGVALMISGLQVAYRDVKYIVEVALLLCFYMTPIFYPLYIASDVLKDLLYLYILNPMVGLVTMYRIALLGDAHIANLEPYVNIPILLSYTAVSSVFFFLAGYRIFKRHEPAFADLVK